MKNAFGNEITVRVVLEGILGIFVLGVLLAIVVAPTAIALAWLF